ncbi:AraC family transcriptional regulator [Phocaeicola vulgatus]|nr:helix-turn-helix domain-containing protein [Phocaeicola vulgatus]
MKQSYDIKVQTVHDYNEFVGVENTHPYVSVIHYDELSPIRHSRVLWAVYGLFLLDDTSEQLGYGSGKYDYHAGSIVCVSPSQIGGTADDGSTFQRRGWALLFSPELFHGTAYEKELIRLEFFRYHVNKALAVTMQERQDCETLLRMLQSELTGAKRKDLITKSIELILAYCSSFFDRQHSITNETKRSHIVSRLEHLLDDYYMAGEQHTNGLPTVRFCADCLCIAPNYLGDLIRQETGDSANHFISRYIVRHAKDLLMSGKSVTETAYALGFDFPSHLSRLFNRIEGITPSTYVRQVPKIESKI